MMPGVEALSNDELKAEMARRYGPGAWCPSPEFTRFEKLAIKVGAGHATAEERAEYRQLCLDVAEELKPQPEPQPEQPPRPATPTFGSRLVVGETLRDDGGCEIVTQECDGLTVAATLLHIPVVPGTFTLRFGAFEFADSGRFLEPTEACRKRLSKWLSKRSEVEAVASQCGTINHDTGQVQLQLRCSVPAGYVLVAQYEYVCD